MSIDALITATERAWQRAHGTLLLPRVFELVDVSARHAHLEVRVTDADGLQFGYRVAVPPRLDDPLLADDGATANWALWNVIVPIVEELETDAEHKYVADGSGIRWIEGVPSE